MRLVQLSRHSIAFPSPEGALREPNGLLALGGDLSPARISVVFSRGFLLATPSSGGRPIPARCYGQNHCISAVV